MQLPAPLRLLRPRSRVIGLLLAGLLAGVLIAALVTALTERSYTSSSQIYLTHTSSLTGSGQEKAAAPTGAVPPASLASYARLATAGPLAKQVVDTLGLPGSPAELGERVTAAVEPGTQLLTLTARDEDPKTAQRVDREVGKELLTLIGTIESPEGATTPQVSGTVVVPASLPTSATAPQVGRALLLGALLGLLLGLAVALAGARRLFGSPLPERDQTDPGVTAPVEPTQPVSRQELEALGLRPEPRVSLLDEFLTDDDTGDDDELALVSVWRPHRERSPISSSRARRP